MEMTEGVDAVPASRRHEGMGGLAKGLAILELFGANRTQVTVSEAAVQTGTTPAAARRCLLTLMAGGYLSHDGKYFKPTPRVLRLTAAYSATATLPGLAIPFLVSARDCLAESVSLAVLDGSDALFVARAESDRIVSAGVRVGATLPAHASATGRVLLASLSDEELDTHLRTCRPLPTTTHTLTTVASIRDRVRQVRLDGVAYTDEELELGLRTMAIPVQDSQGRTHAAMSVSSLAVRVTLEDMARNFLPVLQLEASRLGNML